EEELDEKFGIVRWDRPEEDDELAGSTDAPLRALVKDLVSDDIRFTQKMLCPMKKDLLTLRRMGIFVRDIRADNYRGGQLVDFSVSWTDPHIMMNERYWKRKTFQRDRDWELTLFDRMIDESGVPNPRSIRATSNPQYISMLRPRKPTADLSRSYELDRVLDKRFKRRVTQYLVRWKDNGPEGDKWMDESELQDAQELVQAYESTIATTAKRGKATTSTVRQHARPPPTPSSNRRSPTTNRRQRGRPPKNQKSIDK
ncbi:hypothetical protein MMC14_001404, partial [Varicellaria rhodocarpa]|nr:hypothetical protein [Varicellaria rhodocarpa]